jgi:hypothetical protein
MPGPQVRPLLICGLLLLFAALTTLLALLFLAAQGAIHLEGGFVLSGFAMIQIGFGGVLCERAMDRKYFPYSKLPMHCVIGGCAIMLIGILNR